MSITVLGRCLVVCLEILYIFLILLVGLYAVFPLDGCAFGAEVELSVNYPPYIVKRIAAEQGEKLGE